MKSPEIYRIFITHKPGEMYYMILECDNHRSYFTEHDDLYSVSRAIENEAKARDNNFAKELGGENAK